MTQPSPFDKLSEVLAEKNYIDYRTKPNCVPSEQAAFRKGRLSAKPPLEIACRALEDSCYCHIGKMFDNDMKCKSCIATDEIRKLGQWPF